MSPCPYIEAFSLVQSIAMPIHRRHFASAKHRHAHIWGPVGQCKVSLCSYMEAVLPVQNVPMPIGSSLPMQSVPMPPHMEAFSPVQSVPMAIYGDHFVHAKHHHAHIWRPFCQCKVSRCLYMQSGWPLQSVFAPIYRGCSASTKCPHAHI